MESSLPQDHPPRPDGASAVSDTDPSAQDSVRWRIQGILAVAILAVVAVLAVSQPDDPDAPKRDDARRALRSLRQAIVNFRLDHLAYPWPVDAPPPATPMANILRELAPNDARLGAGRPPRINTQKRDYIRIDERLLIETSEGGRTLGDPWGRAYRILLERNAPRLRLWSAGPDGRDGTADDLIDE